MRVQFHKPATGSFKFHGLVASDSSAATQKYDPGIKGVILSLPRQRAVLQALLHQIYQYLSFVHTTTLSSKDNYRACHPLPVQRACKLSLQFKLHNLATPNSYRCEDYLAKASALLKAAGEQSYRTLHQTLRGV